MENQHRQIKGYRDLTQEEINAMNQVKELGISIGRLVATMEESARFNNAFSGCDQRWVAIGRTHLQQGVMALTRAIAKPEFF